MHLRQVQKNYEMNFQHQITVVEQELSKLHAFRTQIDQAYHSAKIELEKMFQVAKGNLVQSAQQLQLESLEIVQDKTYLKAFQAQAERLL